MRRHLERAVQLATEQGRPAARCETLARLAIGSARLGVERDDQELMALAEASAREAKALIQLLSGHPPWGVQADAALAEVALARGATEEAIEAARNALIGIMAAMHEDLPMDAVRAVGKVYMAAASEPEKELVRYQIGLTLAMTAMRTFDEDIRSRWFRGPIGRELVALAGPLDAVRSPEGDGAAVALEESDLSLLRLLTEGHTNQEIAQELGLEQEEVRRRLAEMFARIGASSRAEATAFAFRERVV